MRHHYRTSQWLPYPVELVFAFFANPQNLAPLMPRWQQVRIEELRLTPPPPRPMAEGRLNLRSVAAGEGTEMVISFRPIPYCPLRLPWDARITAFVWNEHFCDEQGRRGPFKYWKHCHWVEAEERDGTVGTRITDDLTFSMRVGVLGEMGYWIAAKEQIASLFDYRQKKVAEILARFPLKAAGSQKPAEAQ
jgi:ligand-binding SRPBCC domain-containing protein